MPYITGAKLKVRRAGKHLSELERKAMAFLERNPDQFSSKLDPEDFDFVIYEIPPNRAPPTTFGPVFGDIVHNLRSALDHIAWQLALLTKSKPYKRTAFPIIIDRKADSLREFKRLTKDVWPAAIPIIRQLQPYHRGKNAKLHELAILHALWNDDKHRSHAPITGRQHFPLYTGRGRRVWTGEDGTKFMRVLRASDPKKNLETHFRSEVLFELPDSDERVSLAVLRAIYEFVRDEVLPEFSPYLPESTGLVEREMGFKER